MSANQMYLSANGKSYTAHSEMPWSVTNGELCIGMGSCRKLLQDSAGEKFLFYAPNNILTHIVSMTHGDASNFQSQYLKNKPAQDAYNDAMGRAVGGAVRGMIQDELNKPIGKNCYLNTTPLPTAPSGHMVCN